jgi:hypothetical protein
MYAGIRLSIIPSMRHPTAASSDDLWQFHMPEYLQGLEAVSKNIGVPIMGRSAVRPGDYSSFRDLYHAADLGVGAPLQAVQVVKAGKGLQQERSSVGRRRARSLSPARDSGGWWRGRTLLSQSLQGHTPVTPALVVLGEHTRSRREKRS